MKRLEEIYQEILNCNTKWNYYTNREFCPKNSIWKNQEDAMNFIKDYLKNGSKSVLVEIVDEVIQRNLHTVSLFFLGIHIYNELNWDGKITVDDNSENYKYFMFQWFLACLFHDAGYYFENNKGLYSEYKTLNQFMNAEKIENERNMLNGLNGQEYEHVKMLNNYYKYVHEERGRIDHGITGGILLYAKLVKNVENHGDGKIEDGIMFSSEYYQYYLKAADAVARHNIWFAREGKNTDRIENYKTYDLDDILVISEDSDRQSLDNDNVLYFLLCLADSIEPLKTYSCVKPEYVLNSILFEIERNIIRIGFEDCVLKEDELWSRCKSLGDWLDVQASKNGDFIEIEIGKDENSSRMDKEQLLGFLNS